MRKQIFIFNFICICFFCTCENDPEDLARYQARLNTQIETVKEVEILYSDSARVQVRVTGPTMLNYLEQIEQRQEFTDGIHIEFFGPYHNVTSELVANYALRNEREGIMIARDSVVWWSVEGEKLETEELIWDERKAEVYTQKFARITTPREIIYGHGFRANQDFSNARIQQVEGIITVDEPE